MEPITSKGTSVVQQTVALPTMAPTPTEAPTMPPTMKDECSMFTKSGDCGPMSDKCTWKKQQKKCYNNWECGSQGKKGCRARAECEYNRKTGKCVDLGETPCSDFMKAIECINANPTGGPRLGCRWNKDNKTCGDNDCTQKTKKTGCEAAGCSWDGSSCSEPSR